MNEPTGPSPQRRLRKLAATVALIPACLATLPAHAQITSPDDSATAPASDTVTLNPFVVNTDKDVGYTPTSTLGGTRTNTALKDIANPLDIFIPELMQDLAIENIQDLTSFANGVEPNAAGDFNSGGEEREVWNYNYMQIRGFKVGTVTRNFMQLNAQFEAYNSERVEFSKGPNAILAGMSDPGGGVNFSTKIPKLGANGYSISHRTDDLGSQRATLDFNQVIIKDELALRLNALWEDKDFYRHPAYIEQHAWHLTAQWRPTQKTTVNVGYEDRRSDRASPRGIFASDYVSAWLNAGAEIATGVPSNNNVIIDGVRVPAASVGMATINANTWVLDSYGNIRNVRGTARGADSFVNGGRMDTAATGLDFPRDVWVGGPNGINDSDWRIAEVSVTHEVTKDFNIELAFGHSDNHVRQGNSVSRNLYVDTTGFGTDAHGGELYAETRPFWIDRQFDIEHYRGTAAYKIDLTEKNKWLGVHQIAGVYEYNQRNEWQNNGRLSLTQTPTGPITGALTTPFWIRDYLNPAAGNYSMHDLRDLYYSDGINQDGYVAAFVPTESWAFYRWRVEQDTALGVLQSRWFSDRLITTVGVRKDDVTRYVATTYQDPVTRLWKSGTLESPAGDHPSSAPFLNLPRVDSGVSRNYGAVFHATNWLSFTANFSTNVAPGSESRGLNGDYLPQSSGESIDYGVRLNLFNDRVNVSLVHFETDQKNAPAQNTAISSPIDQLQSIETILYENGITPGDRLGSSGDWSTADRRAKGEELTLTANPNRNWTLRLTASRLVNRQTNLAPDVRAYYNANLPFYEQQDPTLTASGGTTTLGTYIANAKNRYALMNTRENVETFPSSEYTVRGTTKYSFDRTFLKGAFIGGSARWTSKPVIGYYRTINEAGSPFFDSSRPVKGDDPIYVDMFLGYQRRLSHKLTWRIQVNISNLFDRDDPVPFNAVNNADADDFAWVAYGYRPVDGRVISLTNTISF